MVAYLSQPFKASPIAQKMAEDSGLDLRTVTARDHAVKLPAQMLNLHLPANRTCSNIPLLRNPLFLHCQKWKSPERLPLKGVRGIIADRMGNSSRTTARVTLFLDDVTDFVTFREKLKATNEIEWGFAPGYNELLAQSQCMRIKAILTYEF